MKQLRSGMNYFNLTVRNSLSFIAHVVSVGVASVVLFMFGFYVIPVFGDTGQQLTNTLNSLGEGKLTPALRRDLQRLLQTPHKNIVLPNGDDDRDGIPNFLEGTEDSDGDGLANYLDWDSDNDGISDRDEIGLSLKRRDVTEEINDMYFDRHIIGFLDRSVKRAINAKKESSKTSQSVAAKLQNKTVAKKIIPKANASHQQVAKPNRPTVQAKPLVRKSVVSSAPVVNDTDKDGLPDKIELALGTDPMKRDSDNDGLIDPVEIGFNWKKPLDSDRDGIIDALDKDDDNDGILTKLEDIDKNGSVKNDDTDKDGVPNYQDANDDGDNLLTRTEGGTKDSDNDGILDYLDSDSTLAKGEAPAVVVLYNSSEKSSMQVKQEALAEIKNPFKDTLSAVKKQP